jgi:hypothetical protein
LTAAFDGGSGRAGEPRSFGHRLAALGVGPIGGRWIPHGTRLIHRRFVLPFCLVEHGGLGVDDHLVHLRFICRWRLAQKTLGHQDEGVGFSTLLWFVAGELLSETKLLGRLDDASVIIENLSAGGSKRRVEHGCILRR